MSLGLPRTVLGQSGPYIDMWPEGTFQSPNLEVTIIVCDDSGLSTYRKVQLNGATVSSAFGPWPQSSCAMLTGTVQLQPGTNSIFAEFQNTQGYYAGAWIYPVYTPPQVAVTPKNGVLTTPASSPSIAQFVITNPGASNTRYNLVPQCSPAAINCAAPAHVTVMPGQSEPVNVTFTSGAAGTSASVQLQATVHGVPSVTDAGSINVTTTPLVSRPFVERGLCVTIAAGPDAAYECGNLRIAHALPSVRSVNTVRAPTLLYNSEHAHPHPLVHANVTMPPGEALPTTVRATLMVNGVQKPVQDWPGSQWGAAGNTRRIAVGFDALADSTGLYSYQLEVRRITGGSSTVLQIDTGSVPIINRKDSPFGAGWWLAGYEELRFLANNRVLWVGGDGSVRTYDSVGTTATHRIYLAAQVTRPDTLLRQISNGTWSRQLRDGGRVVFTAAGKHAQTVNRLSSFVTTFTLNGSGNLWKITVPPAAAALVYEFTYTGSGSSAKLATITVPDSAVGTVRTTGFTIDGSKRVTAITDPGSPPVNFTYDPTITRRIATRTDRRGTLTRYRFDAARRLASSALKLAPSDSIFVTFCAGETAGLSACQPTVVAPNEVRTVLDGPRSDTVDVTTFWIDRFGAPVRIRNVYGGETSLQRGDPRFPGLVTRMQTADGRISGAVYDGRGNLLAVTDSSHTKWINSLLTYARTRYEWDAKWNKPIKITTPEGPYTRMSYVANDGNLAWLEDGRGSASRTTFRYYGNGLLRAAVKPLAAKDSVEHDATRLNVSAALSPLGRRVRYVTDRLGRITIVRTILNNATDLSQDDSVRYDRLDRPVRQVRFGPLYSGWTPLKSIVDNVYDAEGNLESVTRTMESLNPNTIGAMTTTWLFDAAGRAIRETAPDGARDSTVYDHAGNVIKRYTRRSEPSNPPSSAGHLIAMKYDALNRLVRRVQPSVTYASWRAGASSVNESAPHNPAYGGLTIPGDTTTYEYDAMGRLERAVNADARIRRTYASFGALDTDSLWIRTWARDAEHAYGLRYEYDMNGRVTNLFYPAQLIGGTQGRANYQYQDTTGFLRQVRGLQNEQFTISYNNRSELTQVLMPGGIVEFNTYDNDGLLTQHRIQNCTCSSLGVDRYPDAWIEHTDMAYDTRGKLVSSNNWYGPKDKRSVSYSGMGYAVLDSSWAVGQNMQSKAVTATVRQLFAYDPLGNILEAAEKFVASVGDIPFDTKWGLHSSSNVRQSTFQGGTGRLLKTEREDQAWFSTHSYSYDHQGNSTYSSLEGESLVAGNNARTFEDRVSYYDAAGILRASELRKHVRAHWQVWVEAYMDRTQESYRYDPLGRRILVRTHRDCFNFETAKPHCDLGSLTRTVWSDVQEVVEIRRPLAGMPAPGLAGDTVSTATMESDVASLNLPPRTGSMGYEEWRDPNSQYGRVAYTHGFGIDRPLSFTRLGYVDRSEQLWYSQPSNSLHSWPTFTVVPHWNSRGEAFTGTFANGAARYRITTFNVGREVAVGWSLNVLAYNRLLPDTLTTWHGSLINQKLDAVGTLYRRNRYYDPATGRFTQEDPIGLAGGLNLYGFAGGDPVNFSDPFGLCRRPKGLQRGEVGICIQTFIKSFPVPGVADNRGPRSNGGTYRTNVQLRVNPQGGSIVGEDHSRGRTAGVFPAWGGSSATAGEGGNINVSGWGMNTFALPPFQINYDFDLKVSADGGVSLTGATHDGYPSYEIWVYRDGQEPQLLYHHEEGKVRELRGSGEQRVP